MMIIVTLLQRKTTQSLVASILILSMLAGMLSACNMIIVTPIPTDQIAAELTPSQDLPATQELTLVSPTEAVTEMPTLTLTPEPTITMLPTESVTLTLEQTPTVEVTKINEILEFAPRFEPTLESVRRYTANVDGIEIPISIGVTENVTILSQDNDNPVKAWEINDQSVVDGVGEYFLHSCYFRYTKVMGNSVTYEDYKQLVKNGEGKIDIVVFDTEKGGIRRGVVPIDPSRGFSLVWTYDKYTPLKMNLAISMYFGVDSNGRLIMATNGYRLNKDYDKDIYGDSLDESLVFDRMGDVFYILALVKNECMINGSISASCGMDGFGDNTESIQVSIDNALRRIKEGLGPDFSILR